MSPDDANLSPTGGPTIRSNFVYFLDLSKTITDVQPNGQWMVSDGQPSKPPAKVTPNGNPAGNGYTIEFDAGRQGTSAVADSFNTVCGGVSNEWCGESFDSSPSELNFYFGLNLFVGSGNPSVTVYLAQGSNWSNNWWIGGSCITNIPGLLKATVNGEAVTLLIQSSGDNGFNFSLATGDSPSTKT